VGPRELEGETYGFVTTTLAVDANHDRMSLVQVALPHVGDHHRGHD